MNSTMINEVIGAEYLNQLHSKTSFDRVGEEKIKKPGEETPGKGKNPSSAKLDKILNHESILSESPNLHNKKGDIMSEGYIKLPRSLLNNPYWKGMRSKYQKVFITILLNASFTKKSYSIGSNLINIQPGQFCTSIRELMELCNDGVKFKDEKIDKNIVERSVSLFTKIGLVRQEVRHKKSVFTITYSELYEHFNNQSETASETKPRHDRDINEERKESKELKGTYVDDVDSPLSNKKEKTNEEFKLVKEFSESLEINIKDQDIQKWLEKWDVHEIISNLELMMKSKKPVSKEKHGGWMQRALMGNWAKNKENEPVNKNFAEKFKNEKNWGDLKITEKYCTIQGTGIDIQFRIDQESFKLFLEDKYENLSR